jgi:hypothetical protein
MQQAHGLSAGAEPAAAGVGVASAPGVPATSAPPPLPPAAAAADEQQASGSKQRKPYTQQKTREKWSDEEHTKFVEGLRVHGRQWRKIEGGCACLLVGWPLAAATRISRERAAALHLSGRSRLLNSDCARCVLLQSSWAPRRPCRFARTPKSSSPSSPRARPQRVSVTAVVCVWGSSRGVMPQREWPYATSTGGGSITHLRLCVMRSASC